jgi:hypothetical protein
MELYFQEHSEGKVDWAWWQLICSRVDQKLAFIIYFIMTEQVAVGKIGIKIGLAQKVIVRIKQQTSKPWRPPPVHIKHSAHARCYIVPVVLILNADDISK